MLVDRLKEIAEKAAALKKENFDLKSKLQAMEIELTNAVSELENQKNKNKIEENNLKITKFASVLGNDGVTDVEEMQVKLDYFINHIDRCINLLKD